MDSDTACCGFCGRTGADDELSTCFACGGAQCADCPPVCCEQGIASAVDSWLMGLAELQLERL
jgi:hypothetical protein